MKRHYKITEKRQVTLPDEVLEAIGAGIGDSITYQVQKDEVLLRKSNGERPSSDEIAKALADLSIDLSRIKPRLKEARKAISKGIAETIRSEG